MKAPAVDDLLDAYDLAHCIRIALDRQAPWTDEFVYEAWHNGTFNAVVANDWEHVWSEKQCRKIMTLHVANRLA